MIDAVIEGELYSFDTPWQRGGEANVYRFQPRASFTAKHGPGPFLVKLYRPNKTDAYKNADNERQDKLRNYPSLPSVVASPIALAFNREGRVIGLVMALVPDTTPLIKFKRREYRERNGVSIFRLLRIFANLRNLVRALHARDVIIGDFNDKNVLVGKNDEVFLIDADSLQFDIWKCMALVPSFADSRIVRLTPNDPKEGLQLVASFDKLSDWLALDVMLCQILIGTNPQTGGICTLADSTGKLLQGNRRIVNNVSIFHPSVQLSDVATPLSILPEALLSRWRGVFSERTERSAFPEELLDPAAWTVCAQCSTEHGRPKCPICNAPGVMPPAVKPRAIPLQTVFSPGSQILAAAYHNGSMRYLTYRDGAYRREDDSELWRGVYDNQVQFAISGESTIFTRGSRFVVVNGSQPHRGFQTHAVNGITANSQCIYWVDGGSLMRGLARGSVTIETVPSHLTSVWAGEQFGVAMVQAGIFNQILTFSTKGTGFTGTLDLPPDLDTIVDANCVVDELAWITMLVRDKYGAETLRCFVIDQRARLIASTEAPRSTVPWLDALNSSTALATRDKLVVPVPDLGLVRVGTAERTLCVEKVSQKSKDLVTKEPTVGLYLTKQGLLHVSPTTITAIS